MNSIIVHPGRAHADDWLAVALCLAHTTGCPCVYRREPTDDDLQDTDTWVLDVGQRYQPMLHNFDHHQDPDLPCAAILVLEELTGWSDQTLYDLLPWLKTLSQFDTQGPHPLAEKMGLTVPQLFGCQINPIGNQLVQLFGQLSECMYESYPLYQVMRDVGQSLLQELRTTQSRRDELCSRAETRMVRGRQVVYLPPVEGEDDPQFQLSWYQQQYLPQAVASVSASPRGGICLYRVDDNPWTDFRSIEGQPGVRFVHASGFLATVEDLDRAWELLPQCIQPPSQELQPRLDELRQVLNEFDPQDTDHRGRSYDAFRRVLRLINNLLGRLHQLDIPTDVQQLQLELQRLADEYPTAGCWIEGWTSRQGDRMDELRQHQLEGLDEIEQQIEQKEMR